MQVMMTENSHLESPPLSLLNSYIQIASTKISIQDLGMSFGTSGLSGLVTELTSNLL